MTKYQVFLQGFKVSYCCLELWWYYLNADPSTSEYYDDAHFIFWELYL